MINGVTSQASSTLVSASTDTIRESMRSGHAHENHQGCIEFIYIPRANTVLHFVNHSCPSSSETSTNIVGCGLGSLQLPVKDCESLLPDMDVIDVEPSEHILNCVALCSWIQARLKPIMLRKWRSSHNVIAEVRIYVRHFPRYK